MSKPCVVLRSNACYSEMTGAAFGHTARDKTSVKCVRVVYALCNGVAGASEEAL